MTAQELPSDIITNILCRVPVKPLLRFKLVSKTWNTLITSPHFTTLHLTHSHSAPSSPDRHLLLSHSTLSSAPLKHNATLLTFSDIPLAPNSQGTHLLGSCHGLVLVSNLPKDNVFLLNPLTGSRKRVPPLHITRPHHTMVFGFGYDSCSHDYKVLRMLQCIGHRDEIVHNECKVYSLREGAWRWVEDIPYYVHYRDCHGALANEGLHYMVTKKDLDVKFKFIVRFDLGKESFELVDHPDYEYDDGFTGMVLFLWSLGGRLCLLANYLSDVNARADLWVMNEYGKKESWVRLFNVRRSDHNMFYFYKITPIAFSRDGGKLLLRIDNMDLHWFDLKTKRFKKVRVRGLPDVDFGAGDEDATLGVFVGSLVSLDAEDKGHEEGGSVARKNKKKKGPDGFLSQGFKLRL